MANSTVQSFWATYNPTGSAPDIKDDNIIKSLLEFNPTAYQGWWGIILDMVRVVDWAFLRGLCWVADSVATAGTSLLYFLDFYAYKPVQDFVEQFYPFIILASLVFFGVAWIAAMSKKEIPIVDMLKSGAFSWFTFFILPILMIVGVGFTQNLSGGISTTATPSAAIVKNNVWDVRAIDRANWDHKTIMDLKAKGYGAPNYINETKNSSGKLTVGWDELGYIDPQEKLAVPGWLGWGDDSGLSDYGKKLVKYTVNYGGNNKDGSVDSHKTNLAKLQNNIFGDKPSYYAVSWNGWVIGLSLLTYIVFAIILQIRMVRLETQIFLSWSVGSVVSLTQWGTTKRNWEILSKIGMGFTTLLFTQSLLVLFGFGITQLTDLLSSGKINFFAYILLLIGFGMEMVDGPALWQQLFGIDAGIQSAWRGASRGGQLFMSFVGGKLGNLSRNKSGKSQEEKEGKKSDKSPKAPEQKTGSETPPFTSSSSDSSQGQEDKQVGTKNPESSENTQHNDKTNSESVNKDEPESKENKGLNPKQPQPEDSDVPLNGNGTPMPEQGENNSNEDTSDDKTKKSRNLFNKPEVKKEENKPFINWDNPSGAGDDNKDFTPKPEPRQNKKGKDSVNTRMDNPFENPSNRNEFWNSLEDNVPSEPESWRGDEPYGL
jgi:hypothetical protein